MLAVSLDIVNAFNSLSWARVEEAFVYHRLPRYLTEVLRDYFRCESIRFRDRSEREVFCGVPHGSMLDLTLWNLAYDKVLRTPLPPDYRIVCYPNDTLVLAEGADETRVMPEAAVVVRAIVALRLEGSQ